MRKAEEAVEGAIGPLNARESKLIDATKAIAHAVEREANQNQLIGWKSLTSGAVGGAAYAGDNDPAAVAAVTLAARVGLHPAVASRVALTAVRVSKTLGVSAATAARLAIYAANESSEQPND